VNFVRLLSLKFNVPYSNYDLNLCKENGSVDSHCIIEVDVTLFIP